MIMCVLSDLAWLPILGEPRKSLYISNISFFIVKADFYKKRNCNYWFEMSLKIVIIICNFNYMFLPAISIV